MPLTGLARQATGRREGSRSIPNPTRRVAAGSQQTQTMLGDTDTGGPGKRRHRLGNGTTLSAVKGRDHQVATPRWRDQVPGGALESNTAQRLQAPIVRGPRTNGACHQVGDHQVAGSRDPRLAAARLSERHQGEQPWVDGIARGCTWAGSTHPVLPELRWRFGTNDARAGSKGGALELRPPETPMNSARVRGRLRAVAVG